MTAGCPGAAHDTCCDLSRPSPRPQPKQLLYVHEACVRLSSWSHERSIK